MPIYLYECKRCNLRFEFKRNFGENGGNPCPQCQHEMHRLFSPVPIIFKGSGFYVTDNRRNHSFDATKFGKLENEKTTESFSK